MFPRENLHHAYFIEGDRQSVIADIEAYLESALGIVRQGHPDVHFGEHDSFGIDESRALSDMQSMKPIKGDRKIFILSIGAITSEAQNSLLKVFEEPTPGTHFFVVATSARILLPTLRSRMVVISHESARAAKKADVKEFMRLPIKERLAFVQEMIGEKDKAKAEDFLSSLVTELHTAGKTKAIKEILPLMGYLKDRASSLKLILERVALLSF